MSEVFLEYQESAAQAIQHICAPLFLKSPVCAFHYQRVYQDGSQAILATHKEAEIAQLCIPQFLEGQQRYSYIHALDGYDLFVIYEAKLDHFEICAFWMKESPHAEGFYINHLNILERFRLYFFDKARVLMNVLHKKYKNHSWCNLVIRPDAQNSTQLDPDEFLPEKLHFYVGEKERYITQKELLCALHLIRGFNNREIAKALQISVRTVEKHMDALRTKISVTNRQQLIEFFLKLGLYRL